MLFIKLQPFLHCLNFFNNFSNMFILLFNCDAFLFLLSEIQSLEYFEVYPMYSIILLLLGLLFISDIICGIESPLIVGPDKHQRLFDSN
jgi:hypothetical protein